MDGNIIYQSDKWNQLYYMMTDKQKQFEERIQKEIEGISLEGCWLDPREDYRRSLNQFKVNKRGDLLINRGRTKLNDGWEIFIPSWRVRLCLHEGTGENRCKEPEYINIRL